MVPKLSSIAIDDAALSETPLRAGSVRGNPLSDKALECYEHADRCARQAEQQRDPKLREDFRYLEQGWLKLARSLEFAERTELFTRPNK